MFLDKSAFAVAIAAATLSLSACSDGDTIDPVPGVDAGTPAPMTDAGVTPPTDAGPAFAASAKARIRFKGAERMRNDIARALDLSANEVCQELGQYDCVDFVHTIALGGVEPYVLGINEPLDNTTATTPLAVERVVLSACGARVDRDLAAGEQAVIFRGLSDSLDPSGTPATEALTTLYRRSLLRDPRPSELEHLRGLHRDLSADGLPGTTRDWAVLSCFAVLTSVEALFY